MPSSDPRAELLRWYVAMGADEAIEEQPQDRFATAAAPRLESRAPRAAPAAAPQVSKPTASTPAAATPARPAAAAPQGAREAAAAAQSLEELAAAVAAFEGCTLKRTATHTVFADGVATAPLMIIGEAPGADEDRLGRPFVGRSGQLLDRMLAAIGHDRQRDAYISNILFWRPPGNRKPTEDEIAACLPFVWRHIALAAPRLVMLCGGTAAASLLGRSEGITRLRGRWFDLEVPGLAARVPAIATYHPSFLLRAPGRKGEAWRDLLTVQTRLASDQ